MTTTDELGRLISFLEKGLLTREEFESQKRALLSGSGEVGPAAVGAYRILGTIGHGGMGSVYRARHRTEARALDQGGDIALKLMHPQVATSPEFRRRFEREASLGMRLQHPNIVRVFDLVIDGQLLGLVMELVEGRPLSTIIGSEVGPIPWLQAQPLLAQLLSGVGYAHRHGIIHRDLKPENVLVGTDGVLKVIDFGIAREGEGSTRTGVMGTVDYMAPEQYTRPRDVDHRADIYALGVTLYEMLAGRLPWDRDEHEFMVMKRKIEGRLPPASDFYPYIPEPILDALRRALAVDPEGRFPSAAALARALDVQSGSDQLIQEAVLVEQDARSLWRVSRRGTAGLLTLRPPGEALSLLKALIADPIEGVSIFTAGAAGRQGEQPAILWKLSPDALLCSQVAPATRQWPGLTTHLDRIRASLVQLAAEGIEVCDLDATNLCWLPDAAALSLFDLTLQRAAPADWRPAWQACCEAVYPYLDETQELATWRAQLRAEEPATLPPDRTIPPGLWEQHPAAGARGAWPGEPPWAWGWERASGIRYCQLVVSRSPPAAEILLEWQAQLHAPATEALPRGQGVTAFDTGPSVGLDHRGGVTILQLSGAASRVLAVPEEPAGFEQVVADDAQDALLLLAGINDLDAVAALPLQAEGTPADALVTILDQIEASGEASFAALLLPLPAAQPADTTDDEAAPTIASPIQRLGARLLDAGALLAALPVAHYAGPIPVGCAAAVVLSINLLLLWRSGQSLSKKVFRTAIVTRGGEKASLARIVLVRVLPFWAGSFLAFYIDHIFSLGGVVFAGYHAVYLLSYLSILGTARATVPDRLAGTRVVTLRRAATA